MVKKIVFQCLIIAALYFSFAAISYAADIIIDNGDPGYTETGTWSSSSVKGYNGTSTRYSNVGVRTAQWTPSIVEAGEYEVFIYKIVNSTAGDKDVDIDVVYEGGTISTEQDWTTGTSGWVSLGKYPFAAGTSGYVIMNGELSGTATYSRADAVKFVNSTPPPVTSVVNAPVGTYYVDPIGGNDANSGMGESSAWKTLDKVNSYTYQPGTTIRLKSGGYWVGQLKPKGSGSVGSPIIINSYGTGNKPIIDGNGITNAGVVHLYNQQYWEINNLEIINDAQTADTRFGIYIQLDNYGTANHIYVKDCYVHNVKGDNSNPHKGVGIFYLVSSADTSIFNDILIENNTVKSVDRSGIILRSPNGTFSTGVVIRKNFVEDIGGDGIVAKTSKAPLVEYNIAKDTSARANNANAAIWTWYTDDAVVQYNESYNTVRLPNNLDANGFDSDFNNNRSIFQYNYSHDNGGGFILVIDPGATSYNDATIVRYNISQNDKEKVINLLGDISNTQFYNNTFYLDSSSSAKMIEVRNYYGIPRITSFTNNIFYNLGSVGFDLRIVDNFSFDSNIFYGMAPPVPTVDAPITVVNAITADPKLVNPGTGGANINFSDPNRLSGYRLQPDSPAINAGRIIENNGGKDFWGHPLYIGQPDIGAYEAPATTGNGSEVKVQSIQITSTSATISTKNGSLQLLADVLPTNADNLSVTWAVYEADSITPSDKAAVNASGLLTAAKDGTVKVVATAADGSGIQSSTSISISGQTSLPTNVLQAKLTGQTTVQPGASFTTYFGLSNVSGSVYAADITVRFDASAIDFVSVEPIKPGFTVLQTQTTVPGQIRIIAVSEGETGALTTSGDVIKINWMAKPLNQPVTTNLELTKVTVANALGQKTESLLDHLLVSIILSGDVNGDNAIDVGDLGKVAANYGKTAASADWNLIKSCDFNDDGKIDISDLVGIAHLILQ